MGKKAFGEFKRRGTTDHPPSLDVSGPPPPPDGKKATTERRGPAKTSKKSAARATGYTSVTCSMEGAEEYLKPIYQDGEVILEVECGQNKALMYLSKLCQGSKGPCIYFQGSWLTPNEFQYVSGRESAKDWKRSIRHHGKSMKLLLSKGILTVHSAVCDCDGCRISSPVNRCRLAEKRRESPVREDRCERTQPTAMVEWKADVDYHSSFPLDKSEDSENSVDSNTSVSQKRCSPLRESRLSNIIDQLRTSKEKEVIPKDGDDDKSRVKKDRSKGAVVSEEPDLTNGRPPVSAENLNDALLSQNNGSADGANDENRSSEKVPKAPQNVDIDNDEDTLIEPPALIEKMREAAVEEETAPVESATEGSGKPVAECPGHTDKTTDEKQGKTETLKKASVNGETMDADATSAPEAEAVVPPPTANDSGAKVAEMEPAEPAKAPRSGAADVEVAAPGEGSDGAAPRRDPDEKMKVEKKGAHSDSGESPRADTKDAPKENQRDRTKESSSTKRKHGELKDVRRNGASEPAEESRERTKELQREAVKEHRREDEAAKRGCRETAKVVPRNGTVDSQREAPPPPPKEKHRDSAGEPHQKASAKESPKEKHSSSKDAHREVGSKEKHRGDGAKDKAREGTTSVSPKPKSNGTEHRDGKRSRSSSPQKSSEQKQQESVEKGKYSDFMRLLAASHIPPKLSPQQNGFDPFYPPLRPAEALHPGISPAFQNCMFYGHPAFLQREPIFFPPTTVGLGQQFMAPLLFPPRLPLETPPRMIELLRPIHYLPNGVTTASTPPSSSSSSGGGGSSAAPPPPPPPPPPPTTTSSSSSSAGQPSPAVTSGKRSATEADKALDLSTKRMKFDYHHHHHHHHHSPAFRLNGLAAHGRDKFAEASSCLKDKSPRINGSSSRKESSRAKRESSSKPKTYTDLSLIDSSRKACTCPAVGKGLLPRDIHQWSVEESFRNHGIDGKTLPLLSRDQLMKNLGMKITPAMMLSEAVARRLRDEPSPSTCNYCQRTNEGAVTS